MTEAEPKHRSVLAFRGAAVVARERPNASVTLGDVTLGTGEMAVVELAVRRCRPLDLVRWFALEGIRRAWADGIAIVGEFLGVFGGAGKGPMGLVVRDGQDKGIV